jgi:hypothetical protein
LYPYKNRLPSSFLQESVFPCEEEHWGPCLREFKIESMVESMVELTFSIVTCMILYSRKYIQEHSVSLSWTRQSRL